MSNRAQPLYKASVPELVRELHDYLNSADTVTDIRKIDETIAPLYEFARQRIEELEAAESDRDSREKRRIAANEAAWNSKRGAAA